MVRVDEYGTSMKLATIEARLTHQRKWPVIFTHFCLVREIGEIIMIMGI